MVHIGPAMAAVKSTTRIPSTGPNACSARRSAEDDLDGRQPLSAQAIFDAGQRSMRIRILIIYKLGKHWF
jgi:hypothetical protein